MKKYNIIYADPPWSYKDSGCQGAAANQYDTMSVEEICKLPVKDIADKNCVLFLWATYPKLPEARTKIIKLMGELPRVELFARERVDGWDAWGNEVQSDQLFDMEKL